MEFKDRLKYYQIGVDDITRAGWSQRTAYAWLSGSRTPKGITQELVLDHIKAVRSFYLGRCNG